jgi:hypothetical protein
MEVPIKFLNEHAHLFAKNIQGIAIGIELSHPVVVRAVLQDNNTTLRLEAGGSGECNVIVYLLNNPMIYDVFKVRVTSVVKPSSPVQLHVGGQITFKLMD